MMSETPESSVVASTARSAHTTQQYVPTARPQTQTPGGRKNIAPARPLSGLARVPRRCVVGVFHGVRSFAD